PYKRRRNLRAKTCKTMKISAFPYESLIFPSRFRSPRSSMNAPLARPPFPVFSRLHRRDYNYTIMRSRLHINKVFVSIAILATLIQAPMISSLTSAREQEPAQNTEIPAIKVTTRLVQVNVVVHDKKGEPVSDLTKDDFILLDKGQEQKIQFFSKESSETVPTNTPPLPPGVVSNRYTNFTSGGSDDGQRPTHRGKLTNRKSWLPTTRKKPRMTRTTLMITTSV